MSILSATVCNTLFNNIAGEFMLAQLKNMTTDLANDKCLVFRFPMLENVLHHVIAILILYQLTCTTMQFFK